MSKCRRPPFTVDIIGPAWANGGTEQHANLLARFLDPRRINVKNFFVTDFNLISDKDTLTASRPVTYLPPAQIETVTKDTDCLITWGIETDLYLKPSDRQTRIHVCHGVSDWQQRMTTGSTATSDAAVTVSPIVGETLYIDLPQTCIPNAIDTARLTETDSRDRNRIACGFKPDDIVIGYVGRLAEDKQLPVIIKTAIRLGERYKVLIVGEGPERTLIESMVIDQPAGKVQFAVDHNYLGDYFNCMDWFMMPSKHEGFCLSAAEAMYCGVPIAMTRTGIAADYITHRVNGLIITEDHNQIAEAIRTIDRQPGQRAMISHEGRMTALEHFLPRRFATDWQNLIEELIESKIGRWSESIPY